MYRYGSDAISNLEFRTRPDPEMKLQVTWQFLTLTLAPIKIRTCEGIEIHSRKGCKAWTD